MHGEVRGTRSQLCLPLGRCALWDQTQHRSALSKTESVHEQGWPVSSSVFTPVRVHLLTICLSVCHHPTGGVGFSSPGPSSEQTPTRFLFFFFFFFCFLQHFKAFSSKMAKYRTLKALWDMCRLHMSAAMVRAAGATPDSPHLH